MRKLIIYEFPRCVRCGRRDDSVLYRLQFRMSLCRRCWHKKKSEADERRAT